MRALENTIIRLLRSRPFYGQLLMQVRKQPLTAGSKAAGVTFRDGVPTILINEASFEQFAPREQESILAHLIAHLVHLHPLRQDGHTPHDWDVATDLAINQYIDDLPKGALLPLDYNLPPDCAAEEYYRMIVPPFDMGNVEGSGLGDHEQAPVGTAGQGVGDAFAEVAPLDSHDAWQESCDTPATLAEEMIRSMVRDALAGADQEAPGELQQAVDQLLHPPPIPWRQILRQFVATAGRTGSTSTWTREHRRFSHQPPGRKKQRRLSLLVAIDVSDSTDTISLREAFATELLRIAQGRQAQITVVYANSRIQRVEQFSGSAIVATRYDGGGFTDLRPVFDYATTLTPRPTAVIYLTDGIGPVPEEMSFPTLWVLTSDGERPAPWGVELRLSV